MCSLRLTEFELHLVYHRQRHAGSASIVCIEVQHTYFIAYTLYSL